MPLATLTIHRDNDHMTEIPIPQNYLQRFIYPKFKRSDGRPIPNLGGWQGRHRDALIRPEGAEESIRSLLSAWARYADSHRERYRSGIGDDRVLGAKWAAIGTAIRGMIDGDCGRLHGGTLDDFICDTLRAEGLDPDRLVAGRERLATVVSIDAGRQTTSTGVSVDTGPETTSTPARSSGMRRLIARRVNINHGLRGLGDVVTAVGLVTLIGSSAWTTLGHLGIPVENRATLILVGAVGLVAMALGGTSATSAIAGIMHRFGTTAHSFARRTR
jgi:hypothetical protein